jgi:hypothetical protein
VGSTWRTSSCPSAGWTTSRIQATSPSRGATTMREGRSTGGSGTAARLPPSRCTAGSGNELTANALPGVRLARCWPKLGVGVARPVTLPSQVMTCSWASSSGSSEARTPAEGAYGPHPEASEARTVAASGGSAVSCTAIRCESSMERTMWSRSAAGPDHSGAIAMTCPPACRPEATASTRTPT